ncbi:MAG: phosphatidylserine/phosphatidylglycerophosphate/cardiolipin synthase family protein, partial [Thiohalorhabdaceae bacterium]
CRRLRADMPDKTSVLLSNIHRESSRRHYGERRWRDTHIGVTGPLARQAHEAFRALWQERPWSPGPEAEPASAVVLPNKSPDCEHRLRCIFAAMFGSARRRIDLTTPYFVPDEVTQRALIEAAERGVRVRVLVPHQGDVPPVRWIARGIYTRLMRHGVAVYGYRPRLLHAKTVAVDGDWVTVGTANLDYRSLFVNHEINLCARDPGLAADLEEQFEADLAESEAFTAAGIRRGSLADRALAPVAWAARRWL